MDRNDIFRYEILSTLEASPSETTRRLTAKIGCSIRLTHELVGELARKGYVSIVKHNPRRWDYLLTPTGIAEKARLTMEFLDFTFKFYHEARKRSSQLCLDLAKARMKNVAFLGAGQLAEISFLGVKEHGLKLVEVYDGDGEAKFLGMRTKALRSSNESEADALIVCLFDKANPMNSGYLPQGLERTSKTHWIF